MKTLTLTKGEHRHVIRYEPGAENLVLDALMEKVKYGHDPDVPFDWFDEAQGFPYADLHGAGCAVALAVAQDDFDLQFTLKTAWHLSCQRAGYRIKA